ncbi:protein NUCLEAR FUSION DEFECTIVE 6, chloroplastic/mitochondrial-like [Gossypium australe]|uniref:Protein NUCLEAR FUSION DEFECTIVE 6, chloroplastic/mitochondrial-like n=1 Tax=Gossypium australe TaxID=47621 RepID=A0A5B6W8F6_9ROSI|nr:protein NUCLEAR FUSION DEFECTIVE 6, chloroplastic/mitochondrial-like [Gossypium australe]
MAGSTILFRLSSSRLKALPVKLKSSKPVLPTISPLKSSSQSQFSSASSSSVKRISGISRLPVELSSLISMMPLHSAVASARLRSFLAIESQSWGLIPQGLSIYSTHGMYLYAFITAPVIMSEITRSNAS